MESQIMILEFSIGDVIYADTAAADTWERRVIEQGDDLNDILEAAREFDKDFAYYRRPEGHLKKLMLVSKGFHEMIRRFVFPRREFKFGDVNGFLDFLTRPISFPLLCYMRKVNIMVWREGACLLPLGETLKEVATPADEGIPEMTSWEAAIFRLGLKTLRVTELKLTIRDGISHIGMPSLSKEIDRGLMENIAEEVNAWNWPLRFFRGAKPCIVMEFEDTLGKYGQHWTFPLE